MSICAVPIRRRLPPGWPTFSAAKSSAAPGRIDVKLGGANVFIAPVKAGDGVHTPPVTPYQGLDHFGLTGEGH